MSTIACAAGAFLASLAVFNPEPMDEETYRRTGGYLFDQKAYRGKVVVANAAGDGWTETAAQMATFLRDVFEVNVVAARAGGTDPGRILAENEATAAIVLLEDASAPQVLIAPAERWAKVNLAKLVDDIPAPAAKDKFRTARARKQVIRAFALLCGAGTSQYPDNIMNAASSRELDYCEERLPYDVIARTQTHLEHIGITKPSFTTYKKACREGWAPQPTNDIQKAIWDKVHEIPSKPIKIEYNEKRDKGK